MSKNIVETAIPLVKNLHESYNRLDAMIKNTPKQRPILFSTAMVQAILDGRKTQTRRIVKAGFDLKDMALYALSEYNEKVGMQAYFIDSTINATGAFGTRFPFGKPGDILCVRENWRVNAWWPDDGEMDISFLTDDKTKIRCYDLQEELYNRLWEQSCDDLAKAGYSIEPDERYKNYDIKHLRVRPSIFMPKEATRIWLQVTNVRVERLQDITEADAIAEGVQFMLDDDKYINENMDHYTSLMGKTERTAVQAFNGLWESINGTESWNANPWVWVVEFKVLSTTGKPDNI